MSFKLDKHNRIYIAGHKGMVGSAVVRQLQEQGFSNVITASRQEVDLLRQADVEHFFKEQQPEVVVLAAAKVGGIQANMDAPSEFLFDNLQIQNNVIWNAYKSGVKKFVFLGSSCIYPKECPQPIKEEYLLTNKLEQTNEGYALAKIAGLKQVEYLRRQYGFDGFSLMPSNLYGPNDSFDLRSSHVLSALIRRFTDAVDESRQEITLWGTGTPLREFTHVNDVARAVLYFIDHFEGESFLNIGWGEDLSIRELAEKIAAETGYTGKINWDHSKPDGTMRKCMDVSKMKQLGFKPTITLDQGIEEMIGIYKGIKATGL
jgi:GDP-L-fucose synthase